MLVSGPDMLMVVTDTCPPSTFTASPSVAIEELIANTPSLKLSINISTHYTTLLSTIKFYKNTVPKIFLSKTKKFPKIFFLSLFDDHLPSLFVKASMGFSLVSGTGRRRLGPARALTRSKAMQPPRSFTEDETSIFADLETETMNQSQTFIQIELFRTIQSCIEGTHRTLIQNILR